MEIWLNYVALYVAATCFLMLFRPNAQVKEIWFAFTGLGMTFLCFFNSGANIQYAAFGFTLIYLLGFYLLLAMYQDFPGLGMTLLAMGGPIIFLGLLKLDSIEFILGFSYLTFRGAYLAYEMHIGRTRLPNILRYVGFMLFPLTFIIGPISPYKYFEESLTDPAKHRSPPSRCLGRIFVGIVKCYLYSQLFKTLSFYSYWQSYYEHNFLDFTISSIASALYIYFNFSGACDIMIGASALMGIYVQENFNNPFLSRNLPEFWTRNHITLTQVVRDVVFTPTLLFLARLSRGRHMLLITSLTTIFAFFVVGVWHGSQLGYALFGLAQGVGVVIVNIYGSYLRRAPARVQHWAASTPGRCLSTALTFMYVCYSTVFFGNDAKTLTAIWRMMNFF